MSVKVKKTFGERPVTVVVLTDKVEFDKDGKAEVTEEVAGVLKKIPGYEVIEEKKAPKAPKVEKTEEPDEEESKVEKPAPKKPAPKKPAPKR